MGVEFQAKLSFDGPIYFLADRIILTEDEGARTQLKLGKPFPAAYGTFNGKRAILLYSDPETARDAADGLGNPHYEPVCADTPAEFMTILEAWRQGGTRFVALDFVPHDKDKAGQTAALFDIDQLIETVKPKDPPPGDKSP
jgi:hypothetical protein